MTDSAWECDSDHKQNASYAPTHCFVNWQHPTNCKNKLRKEIKALFPERKTSSWRSETTELPSIPSELIYSSLIFVLIFLLCFGCIALDIIRQQCWENTDCWMLWWHFQKCCCLPDNWIPRLNCKLMSKSSTWKTSHLTFKWKMLRASNICQNH